jgi:hypothetical protein
MRPHLLSSVRLVALVVVLVSASSLLGADDALCDKGPCPSCTTEPGPCYLDGHLPGGICNNLYDECVDYHSGPPSNYAVCPWPPYDRTICVCDECPPS